LTASATTPHNAWFTPVHFLAGMSIGVFALWGATFARVPQRPYLFALALAVSIGTAWELWEYALGLTAFPTDVADTVLDLVADMAGALSAVALVRYYTKA